MLKNDIRNYFVSSTNKKVSRAETKFKSETSNPVINCDKLKYDEYLIFTDGSAYNNGKKNKIQYGGIGIYINDTQEKFSEKLDGKITNNIAELKACIKAINIVSLKCGFDNKSGKINDKKIVIYTDSQYVINCITKWYKNWEKNDWKRYNQKSKKLQAVKNRHLIEKLYILTNKYDTILRYVEAHKSKPNCSENSIGFIKWYGNNIADNLAKKHYININNE
jgi:ribonuclease HI